jgi:hypothetical protein
MEISVDRSDKKSLKRMKKKKKELASEIIESQNAIRKKYKKFRVEQEAERNYLAKSLEPITVPLNTFIKANSAALNVEKLVDNIKGTDAHQDEVEIVDQTKTEIQTTPSSDAEKKEHEKASERNESIVDPLLEQFFKLHSNPSSIPELDKTYGMRHSGNRWHLGDSIIYVDNKDIIINKKRYKGTQGLYELLFLKNPDENIYNDSDLQTYRAMLLATNAHKQRFEQNKQVNSNRGSKYVNIIKQLVTKTGTGMCLNSVRYEYWDDPNELVERLRLLMASKQAGNTSVQNEILSIIEELREARIIE